MLKKSKMKKHEIIEVLKEHWCMSGSKLEHRVRWVFSGDEIESDMYYEFEVTLK